MDSAETEAFNLAARQINRMARFADDGTTEGKATAKGYRHALHIMRTMGGLPIPSVQALAAEEAPQGTLPGLAMAATAT